MLFSLHHSKFKTHHYSDEPHEKSSKLIFVYGQEVKGFHTVDYEAISMLNVSATQQLAKENEALNFKLFAWDVFQEYRFKSTITNGAYYSKPEGYGGLVEQSYQGDMDRYVQEAIEYFHLNFPDLSRNEVIQKIGDAFPFYSSDFALNMHSENEPENLNS